MIIGVHGWIGHSRLDSHPDELQSLTGTQIRFGIAGSQPKRADSEKAIRVGPDEFGHEFVRGTANEVIGCTCRQHGGVDTGPCHLVEEQGK